MTEGQKRFSFTCKQCGEQSEFADQGVRIEKDPAGPVLVHQAFDPKFPGRIYCGRCGATLEYDESEIQILDTDQQDKG